MRIAMIGQKGLPAAYGGIESHVEQLGSRLAALGHEVVVYSRPHYCEQRMPEYRGMRLRYLPSVPTKHLDAITHSTLSSLDSRREPFDIIHYHAMGPCLTAPLARRKGRGVVATIHGQDWRRAKWGAVARLALRAAEHMALRVPDATISVSRSLGEHYATNGATCIHYIPNGVSVSEETDPDILAALGVEPAEYAVYVGRLVPEKGAHYLLEAWSRLKTDRKLVIVGASSFSDGYAESLEGGRNVIFTGYLYGATLATVFRNAGLFVLPSDLEGLPIVLLESLGYGTPVLASDIAPNHEILGDEGTYFAAGNVGNLASKLSDLLPRMDELKHHALEIRQSVLDEYDWDRVAEQTEDLYRETLRRN